MRRWLIRISLVLGSLVLTIAVLEILVRTFAPQDNFIFGMSVYEPDPDADYRLAPNLNLPQGGQMLRTNSMGFRSPEMATRKKDGITRVVCLGDSMTFGLGLPREEVPYPRQLERLLNQRASAPRYEVLNAGISGYGTDQEVATLKSRILTLSPDVVTIGFYASNDVTDNMYRAEKEVFQGLLLTAREDRSIPWEAKLRAGIHRMLVPLHLYRYLLLRWKSSPPPSASTAPASPPAAKAPAQPPAKSTPHSGTGEDSGGLDPRRRDQMTLPVTGSSGYKNLTEDALTQSLAVFHKTPTPLLEELGWPNTFACFREARDLARQNHFRLYVVLLPDRIAVDEMNRQSVFAKLGDDAADLDVELPLKRIRPFLEAEGIPFIDPLEALRKAQHDGPVFIPDDRHLNARGCEVLAREMAKVIGQH
jgi:lysophospholipase L1-like esterase